MSKIALISGGTSGIGRGIAEQFLSEGFKVYAFGRSEEKAKKAADEINHSHYVAFTADITDKNIHLGDVLGEHIPEDHIDCLVNAAGIFAGGSVLEETSDMFEHIMDVNLNSAYRLTKLCLHKLGKSEKANIINISSVHGMCLSNRMVENVGYSVSKAGMDMMTHRLAAMLASEKIRVNSINPGLVATPIWAGAEDVRDAITTETTGLGRVGQPKDIAQAASYLNSAEWVTGMLMNVDGGYMVTK